MLVLMRRTGETIRIGEDVTFTVIGITGGQVRVGVRAPRHVVVDREEVHERRRSGQWTVRKSRRPDARPDGPVGSQADARSDRRADGRSDGPSDRQ